MIESIPTENLDTIPTAEKNEESTPPLPLESEDLLVQGELTDSKKLTAVEVELGIITPEAGSVLDVINEQEGMVRQEFSQVETRSGIEIGAWNKIKAGVRKAVLLTTVSLGSLVAVGCDSKTNTPEVSAQETKHVERVKQEVSPVLKELYRDEDRKDIESIKNELRIAEAADKAGISINGTFVTRYGEVFTTINGKETSLSDMEVKNRTPEQEVLHAKAQEIIEIAKKGLELREAVYRAGMIMHGNTFHWIDGKPYVEIDGKNMLLPGPDTVKENVARETETPKHQIDEGRQQEKQKSPSSGGVIRGPYLE